MQDLNNSGDRRFLRSFPRGLTGADRRYRPLLLVGLLPLSVSWLSWVAPAAAFGEKTNDYQDCATALLDANLPPERVATACARVLHPEDLATCVTEIETQTDVVATDALEACVRVRRPAELATCVVDIADGSPEGDAPAILDFCRRSLLPQQFSQCVVGLKNELDLVSTQAMGFCIDAGDRIRDFDPTFIPGDGTPVEPPRNEPNLPST
ncbi:hypothetical protein JJD41_07265 [Oxynema sp. CENA135]|uniref:hypothetical protein n=1 Tax=Oxynema sp. CENA135 TaxID=984206 RepID=UPI00190D0E35|nr:hypothetical protein [Oxynema sp. CENA135]MBK4729666.1 hypothetical protein [Oxynema sp. CENA135]